MGAGVSAGGGALKSKVFVSEGKDDYFIPLKSLASHLRVYQHCTTGEVLVLVDHLIGDIGGIVEKPNDWFQVSVSKKESKYLETLKVITSLSEKTASTQSERTMELTRNSDSMQFTNGPDLDKMSGRSGDRGDAVRKGKLPPISLFPKVAPSRKNSESSMRGKKLLVLGAISEQQLTETESSLDPVDRDADSDFQGFMPPRDSSKSTLKSSSKKTRVLRGLRMIGTEEDLHSNNSYNTNNSNNTNYTNNNNNCRESTTATDELDNELEAELQMNENTEAENQIDSSVILSRLIRENSVYNPERRTYYCQICGDVADDSYPIEQVIIFFLIHKIFSIILYTVNYYFYYFYFLNHIILLLLFYHY